MTTRSRIRAISMVAALSVLMGLLLQTVTASQPPSGDMRLAQQNGNYVCRTDRASVLKGFDDDLDGVVTMDELRAFANTLEPGENRTRLENTIQQVEDQGYDGIQYVGCEMSTETETPVTPTQTPVTPTQTPVTPTQTPITPTQTPVTPTSTQTTTTTATATQTSTATATTTATSTTTATATQTATPTQTATSTATATTTPEPTPDVPDEVVEQIVQSIIRIIRNILASVTPTPTA